MASYLDRPASQVRRKDRQLTDEAWIDRFLERAAFGHCAVCHDGQPILNSNLFWYDGSAIWIHTGPVGKFRAVVEAGARKACFSVAEPGRILPADTPMEFSTEYASVLVYGELAIVEDVSAKRRALEGLMAKYATHLKEGADYQPMPDADVAQTTVFRLVISERVGKHNVKPADYPAYAYPGESFIDAERAAGRLTVRPKELA